MKTRSVPIQARSASFEVALSAVVLSRLVFTKNRENLRMTSSFLFSPATAKVLAMVMIDESVSQIKRFIFRTGLSEFAQTMVLRMVLTFIFHRGRMSCSQAGGAIATQPVHRSQITRFLQRPTWQQGDFNEMLRWSLLQLESGKGKFIFLIDATLCSQAGTKTQNTFSTGNRKRRPKKGRRYNKNKKAQKTCHSFTFGLLITPSGYRIPFQKPHYTKAYCKKKGIEHRTTAESAADMISSLPLPEDAEVVVLGDTAYDAQVVREACETRNYIWIVPVNTSRVYAGPRGERPRLRTRLKDWPELSLKTIRLRASMGKYADYRRLSRWRIGPKTKPRTYYVHQEKADVHSIGRVQLVFSTTKPELKKATADDVKLLMTNALNLSVSEVVELYSLRWQIELFFKELKSTLGFHQYRFENFKAVEAWVNIAITTVLYLEWRRAKQLLRRDLGEKKKAWWRQQRLHGLREQLIKATEAKELTYLSERLKTSGGIQKIKRLLKNTLPCEYRAAG
jgi:hypothetical protein